MTNSPTGTNAYARHIGDETYTDASSLARCLTNRTQDLAKLENAADCYRDIQNLIERIEHCINRPTPPRYCGNCPTPLPGHHKHDRTCAEPLYAKPADIETTCWHCKTTHNVEQLIKDSLKEAEPLLFSSPDILTILKSIGEPITKPTWYRWIAQGRIKPAGELYGMPAYRLTDARRLRTNVRHMPVTGH